MKKYALALCAVLILFSGCSALSPSDEPTNETTERNQTPGAAQSTTAIEKQSDNRSQEITVQGKELAVNPNVIYEQSLNLLSADADPPDTIVVLSQNEIDSRTSEPSKFRRTIGIDSPSTSESALPTAYVNDPDRVYMSQQIARSESRASQVLVHEYVHVVQYRHGTISALRQELPRRPVQSLDRRATYDSLIEGAALYTQTEYWREYNIQGPHPLEERKQVYLNANGTRRYSAAKYYFGARYVNSQLNSPAELNALYQSPPQTTEQVIHRLPSGSEPPRSLTIQVNDTGDWYESTNRLQTGELFLRVALASELNESAAESAAAGWGNDQRLVFLNDGSHAYAWVIRWDDAQNATEFKQSFGTYLESRAVKQDGIWYDNETAFRLVQPSNETSVIFLGDPDFVRNGTATATEGNVTLGAAHG